MSESILQKPPHASQAVDISSADHTFTIPVVAIRVGGAGNMICQLALDATSRTYAVVAGEVVHGCFSKVIRTSTTASNMVGLSNASGATGA